MLQKNKKQIKESIRKMQYYLEFYDNNGFFPFEKKRIDLTLSGEILVKLKKVKNKSKFIEEVLKEKL